MAKIIVAFDSEQQASQFLDRLANENLGETRGRVLSSTEYMSYPKHDTTAPMITPEMGSIEVRPSETPAIPQPEKDEMKDHVSASVPVTGADGVQVLIEVDDQHESEVHRLLREMSDDRADSRKENQK